MTAHLPSRQTQPLVPRQIHMSWRQLTRQLLPVSNMSHLTQGRMTQASLASSASNGIACRSAATAFPERHNKIYHQRHRSSELNSASLRLQPNLTANSSLLNSSSASSQADSENLSSSSQVHMGFNDTIIHDSSESNDFSSVNSTDVVPISKMPDGEHDSSDSSADWAQTFETSHLADSPAQSMKPSFKVTMMRF